MSGCFSCRSRSLCSDRSPQLNCAKGWSDCRRRRTVVNACLQLNDARCQDIINVVPGPASNSALRFAVQLLALARPDALDLLHRLIDIVNSSNTGTDACRCTSTAVPRRARGLRRFRRTLSALAGQLARSGASCPDWGALRCDRQNAAESAAPGSVWKRGFRVRKETAYALGLVKRDPRLTDVAGRACHVDRLAAACCAVRIN